MRAGFSHKESDNQQEQEEEQMRTSRESQGGEGDV
jgi:hypothetical protein